MEAGEGERGAGEGEREAGGEGGQTGEEGKRLSADGSTVKPATRKPPAVSKNGFTVKMAEKYVMALRETIVFAQKDSVISSVLSRVIPRIEFASSDGKIGNGTFRNNLSPVQK